MNNNLAYLQRDVVLDFSLITNNFIQTYDDGNYSKESFEKLEQWVHEVRMVFGNAFMPFPSKINLSEDDYRYVEALTLRNQNVRSVNRMFDIRVLGVKFELKESLKKGVCEF